MNRLTNIVLISALVLLSACAHDKQEKIAPENVPPQVMNPVKARLPGMTVSAVDRETEKGAIVYDFELVQNGRKYEMDVKEDGTITEIEKEIISADVPAAITKAVKDKYPQATIGEVMEVNTVKGAAESPDHYEITLTQSGKEKEINVSLDGTRIDQVEEDGK